MNKVIVNLGGVNYDLDVETALEYGVLTERIELKPGDVYQFIGGTLVTLVKWRDTWLMGDTAIPHHLHGDNPMTDEELRTYIANNRLTKVNN